MCIRDRAYAATDTIAFEIRDSFCSWNAGGRQLAASPTGATIEKASIQPDLRLDAERLASSYLGGVSFERMGEAGFVEELTPGAIARADRLFHTDQAPWCPEIFLAMAQRPAEQAAEQPRNAGRHQRRAQHDPPLLDLRKQIVRRVLELEPVAIQPL